MEIEDLPNIGAAIGKKLRSRGYNSLEAIAIASPTELVKSISIGEHTAKKIINAARDAVFTDSEEITPKPRTPWDKNEGETDQAYRAYLIYRDMGPPRSLKKAAKIFYGEDGGRDEEKVQQFKKWRTKWRWGARNFVWDHSRDLFKTDD